MDTAKKNIEMIKIKKQNMTFIYLKNICDLLHIFIFNAKKIV